MPPINETHEELIARMNEKLEAFNNPEHHNSMRAVVAQYKEFLKLSKVEQEMLRTHWQESVAKNRKPILKLVYSSTEPTSSHEVLNI